MKEEFATSAMIDPLADAEVMTPDAATMRAILSQRALTPQRCPSWKFEAPSRGTAYLLVDENEHQQPRKIRIFGRMHAPEDEEVATELFLLSFNMSQWLELGFPLPVMLESARPNQLPVGATAREAEEFFSDPTPQKELYATLVTRILTCLKSTYIPQP